MSDARARHLRRLRRLRRSARGWSVRAGLLTGATAVLVPYAGLGLPDAIWAAAAGGSIAVAGWRWIDLRTLAASPLPEPESPELAAEAARRRMRAVVRRLPTGHAALEAYDRQRTLLRLRGLSVAEPWRRLDRARLTLSGLADRLSGPAEPALLEAVAAEQSLRELMERAVGVERALRLMRGEAAQPLAEAHAVLLSQLQDGVGAYERLVTAAAGYVAEFGRSAPQSPAVVRLTEATDLLRGITDGLSELRTGKRSGEWPSGEWPSGEWQPGR